MRVAGTAAIAFGLVALVWALVTWQWGDPATSLYTRWEQRSLEARYRQVRDRYALPPQSRRTADPAAAVRAAARRLRLAAHSGQAIGRLEIPRLDLDMVLVDGTDAAALRTGPGLDRRTFMPGEGELSYVAGHRTTFGAPFAHIDRLDAGDRVVLHMPYATLVYRVSRHVIVPADDIARLRSSGREMVALQACHPRFSARERYIVYAVPVRATPVQRRKSVAQRSVAAARASDSRGA
jgi:sortase A